MAEFKIVIQMGNSAMSDHNDIKKALQQVIHNLDFVANGAIWDENGNRVGTFEYRG